MASIRTNVAIPAAAALTQDISAVSAVELDSAPRARIGEQDSTLHRPQISLSLPELRAERKIGSLAHVPWRNFHALLIGIDKYRNYPELEGAVRDIRSMQSFLHGAFEVPEGSKLDIHVLTNAKATSTNIIEGLDRLRYGKSAKPNDAFLIHYAGYGATMPPPEGWHPNEEIQCIVAHEAMVSGGHGSYSALGVVPDRTLNVLLRKLADERGNNITVILDCCHSGSGTGYLDASRERSVDLLTPTEDSQSKRERVTISGDFQKYFWHYYFDGGAALRWQYRHAGLSSYVLLAACSQKEMASDDFSLTQAIIECFKTNYLHTLSYSSLINKIPRLGPNQNPLCEGNNIASVLFDIKDTQLRRLTFDIDATNETRPVLNAGSMVGISPGTKIEIYTSMGISMYEERVGQFTIGKVSATSSTIIDFDPSKYDLSGAVASPSTRSDEVFYVYVPDDALRKSIAGALKDESQADQYGRPRIGVDGAARSADLSVIVDGKDIRFFHKASSMTRKYGLDRLYFTLPAEATEVERITRVLRAGAHFFKHLYSKPENHGVRLQGLAEVRIRELQETKDFVVLNGDLFNKLEPTRQISPREDGAYEVHALRDGESASHATLYGIELANKLRSNGLFVWIFFFNCSVLEIVQFYEPQASRSGTGIMIVDPTLDPAGEHDQPVPVGRNYQSGRGGALTLQLEKGQDLDVSFVRIYVSTRYRSATLSSIVQREPLTLDPESRPQHELRGGGAARALLQPVRGPSVEDDVPDLWDVMTIPLVHQGGPEEGDKEL